MATKRMFSNLVIDSDKFLELPLSAQALYFHVGLKADDDGFVSCVKKIVRMISASDGDLDLLLRAGFLIEFSNSRVFVVRHWRINNDIKTDRYHPTLYQDEFLKLELDRNKTYEIKAKSELSNSKYILDTEWIQDGDSLDMERIRDGNSLDTEISIVENSIGKNSIDDSGDKPRKKFIPPSADEVQRYAASIGKQIDAQLFCDYYESRGWTTGKGEGRKMKSWQAAVRMWTARQEKEGKEATVSNGAGFNAGRL